MLDKNLKKILLKWGITQTRLADLTETNRGQVTSYVRGTKPAVDFMLRLEQLCEYRFSIKELWDTEINYDHIPDHPTPHARPPVEEEGKRATLDLRSAFEVIITELEKMRLDIDQQGGEK